MRAASFAVILSCFAVSAATAQAAAPDVCARLAPQLGLKLQPSRGGGVPEWRANQLGGLGKALFGGSASVSFKLQPPDDATPARQRELADSCLLVKGEVMCNATGPFTLTVSAKRGDATMPVAVGERVGIGTRGTHIVCRAG